MKRFLFMNEVLSSLQAGTSSQENAQKWRKIRDCKGKQSLKKDSFVYLTKIEKVAELFFFFLFLLLEGNLLEKKHFVLLKITKPDSDTSKRCFRKAFWLLTVILTHKSNVAMLTKVTSLLVQWFSPMMCFFLKGRRSYKLVSGP